MHGRSGGDARCVDSGSIAHRDLGPAIAVPGGRVLEFDVAPDRDGVRWRARRVAGGYVALGGKTGVEFSADGSTWTPETLPFHSSKDHGIALEAGPAAIATDGHEVVVVGGYDHGRAPRLRVSLAADPNARVRRSPGRRRTAAPGTARTHGADQAPRRDTTRATISRTRGPFRPVASMPPRNIPRVRTTSPAGSSTPATVLRGRRCRPRRQPSSRAPSRPRTAARRPGRPFRRSPRRVLLVRDWRRLGRPPVLVLAGRITLDPRLIVRRQGGRR